MPHNNNRKYYMTLLINLPTQLLRSYFRGYFIYAEVNSFFQLVNISVGIIYEYYYQKSRFSF